MEIRILKNRPSGVIPVFVMPEGASIDRHPLFSTLPKGDQDFIRSFLKKSPLKEGHTHFIFLPSSEEAFLIGVSPRAKFTHRKAILTARRAVAAARKEKVRRIAVSLDDLVGTFPRLTRDGAAEVTVTQFEIANFEFTRYKTPPPEGWVSVEEIVVCTKNVSASVKKAIVRGKILGEEINKARELANTPGMDMTPEKLAEMALKTGKEIGCAVKILDEKEIQKLGMGGVLGVGMGSMNKPRFIVMEYLKGKKSEKPIVLVGKGVTFDSGGINLKPEQGLLDMHMDMSGGAAVIHILASLARMGIRKNLIGLVPAVENMPSGSSYRPRDVLKTMSGKTIEVLNTDAEGRVILADALIYARRYNPRLIIDVATLTGASVVALGERASALFTTDATLEKQLRALGEKTGDFVWPLPLWEEYEEGIMGTFGDVANSAKTRYGGAINGAVFLWQFIKDTSKNAGPEVPAWVHVDIAPRMLAIEGEFLAKGSFAPSVALLTHFVREF